jgi:hypothetical protein
MIPTFFVWDCDMSGYRKTCFLRRHWSYARTALPEAFAMSVNFWNTEGTVRGFGLNIVG